MIIDALAERVIVHKQSIDDTFFDLRSGLAMEMLQKVVDYRLRLAIVGDFSVSRNKTNRIVFVSTVKEALNRLIT